MNVQIFAVCVFEQSSSLLSRISYNCTKFPTHPVVLLTCF